MSSRRRSRFRRGSHRPAWHWWALALIAAALNVVIVVAVLDYAPRLFRRAPIEPGQTAPAFVLDGSAGERVDLADYLGRRVLLLIFLPGYQ